VFIVETRRKAFNLGRTLLLALALFYFSYHMVSGEKGVRAMIQLQQKVAAAKEELTMVEGHKTRMEQRVQRMYNGSLDADLLDEQARKTLGRARPDEIIYMVDPAGNP
jgi:cell division protein FtsB